jgi:DNA-directed RNA polymerase subunit RPC12/RpoP
MLYKFKNQASLDYDFSTQIECPQCTATATLNQIVRGLCPVLESSIELRWFTCEACASKTMLRVLV